MDSVSPDQWYSVKEVGGFLGFSRDTVIRQIRAGFLKAFVLPGKSAKRRRVYESRRIQGSEILRYVRDHVEQ
jgi:hypothetical protein